MKRASDTKKTNIRTNTKNVQKFIIKQQQLQQQTFELGN